MIKSIFKKRIPYAFLINFISVVNLLGVQPNGFISEPDSQQWRSALYPENWRPGYADSSGRFLHDFSYAGYHQGEKEIPYVNTEIVDVTKPPYNADNTGQADVTSIIQQALDSIGQDGGGVVYLPEGTYKINPGDKSYALRIRYDSTILRGDGPGKTFIYNDATYMRFKNLILIQGSDSEWGTTMGFESNIRHDLLHPVRILPMESVLGYNVGDEVIVRTDGTDEFIAEHKMAGIWTSWAAKVMFLRKIDSIDRLNNLLYIDSPTRYFMKTRDNARVYHAKKHLSECGIENLSIGNLENPKPGWDEETYRTSGTGAYEVHFSHFIKLRNCQNTWVKNVHTFKPLQNKQDMHVLSNCLILNQCRNITVDSCFFQKPQYEGGGGNGYMYTLESNDCLIKNSRANHSRHNFDFKMPHSNGNVIFNCLGENSKYSSDFHMYLSMSNLIDNFTVDGDYLESTFRPYGGSVIHGYSSTQSVFYNTYGQKYHEASWRDYIIESRQFGWGYVIGTSGPASNIRLDPVEGQANGYQFDTSPRDFAEGVGNGENLEPVSLYLDQLDRRLNDSTNKTFQVQFQLLNSDSNNEIQEADVQLFAKSSVTNESGLAAFQHVPASFHVSIKHKNYLPVHDQHILIYSDTTIVVHMSERQYNVNFHVVDASVNVPFGGIRVVFNGISSNTDNQGNVAFTVARDNYNYNIYKQSFAEIIDSVFISSDTTIAVSMERTHADIRFRINNEEEPLQNVQIFLDSDSTFTNSIGYAAFNQMPVAESYEYTVHNDGYVTVNDTLYLRTDTTINLDLSMSVTGKMEALDEANINLWPVPASDQMNIYFSDKRRWHLQIYNIQGLRFLNEEVNSMTYQIDTSELTPGVYVLKTSYQGYAKFLRFIKL